MKFHWLLIHTAALSSFIATSPAEASPDSTLPGIPQSTPSGLLQVAQAMVSDSFKWAIKSKEQSADQPAAPLPATQSAAAQPETPQKTTYFQRARSYGTHPESDPPRYVRNLAKTGIDAFKDLDWLDVGLDYRVRYELRDNDIRRNSLLTDHPVLLRTRGYVGIRNILDPFRMAVEFEDARGYNSQFPRDNRDWNPFELIQTYGELYFKGALGQDDLGNHRPIRIRGGRMAWEAVDRRLLGNNQWRNTTNNFEGFRVTFGQEANDWEFDAWGMQPVIRDINEFDGRNKGQWFYGAVGHWRKWSDVITLQPYFMGLKQDGRDGRQAERDIYAPSIRAYGVVPNTNIDFDFGAIYQFGQDNGRKKSAWSYLLEVGYTAKHDWKPRLSAFYSFVSGDRDPNDNIDNRFERFFGFARPWSPDDYLVMENVKAPKLVFEFSPHKDVSIDGGYSWFWLASDKDRFNNLLSVSTPNAFNRDVTGESGDFIGQSINARINYKLAPLVDTTLGYSHFMNGEFVKNRQQAALGEVADSSNFFYAEVSIRAFK
ncbi:MAG: alginate export family protein [Nitrosomonas sp.]|uniref:alginate export family protein n=1 Tax=Nitrosomonas sp. TaxID=42353 RepID=UPI002734BDE7|nr:alginate export family protein [Nitrosomonas sp.]MDP3280045.1 alginate export family protein [Nitrosomonas sp.]MDP3664375.1 alginate export family protein [Nitrosomonas sp.]MDZ4107687.1 alginate export family protein [Nitrosomonas sp.]